MLERLLGFQRLHLTGSYARRVLQPQDIAGRASIDTTDQPLIDPSSHDDNYFPWDAFQSIELEERHLETDDDWNYDSFLNNEIGRAHV